MTYRDRPEFEAPADIRCDALVLGKPGWPDWAQHNHRCPRRATQSRAGRAVCWQHGALKEINWYDSLDQQTPRGVP